MFRCVRMKNRKAQAKNVIALVGLALVLVAAGVLNRYAKTYVDWSEAPPATSEAAR